jgi:hypothetical protein
MHLKLDNCLQRAASSEKIYFKVKSGEYLPDNFFITNKSCGNTFSWKKALKIFLESLESDPFS